MRNLCYRGVLGGFLVATLLIKEHHARHTEPSPGQRQAGESPSQHEGQHDGGRHDDLVDEEGLDDKQHAHDAARHHPECVGRSRLLLVDEPVHRGDGLEDHADVHGDAIFDWAVEAMPASLL